MNREPRLILALDVENRQQALKWVKLLRPKIGIFKVGLQLYTACGPRIVSDIRSMGGDVFLDLKFNDIPNTMARAAAEAVKQKVSMITVHTLSGPAALKEVAGVCSGSRTKVLGVTILTSICPHFLKDLKINRTLPEEVAYLAMMAKRSGLDGVVCSPLEARDIRKRTGRDFIIVTPGIRSKNDACGDQNRVSGISEAVSNGSNFLVIGRPILTAPDPAAAVNSMLNELKALRN